MRTCLVIEYDMALAPETIQAQAAMIENLRNVFRVFEVEVLDDLGTWRLTPVSNSDSPTKPTVKIKEKKP